MRGSVASPTGHRRPRVTVPTPEWDVEITNGVLRGRNPAQAFLKLVPATSTTVPVITPINTDRSETFPTGYTSFGGIGSIGLCAAVKTTAGVPADTDFSGATPVVPVPPIGSIVYSTSTKKLYVKDAAGSYLASVALT